MRARIKRWLSLTAITLITAAGLTGTNVPTAHADSADNSKVGHIYGFYVPSPARDYGGSFRVSAVEGGHCARVERKSGGGVWTTNYVEGSEPGSLAQSCDPAETRGWNIRDDAKVSDTIGIRLRIYSGVGASTPSVIVLCSSKADCLAMR